MSKNPNGQYVQGLLGGSNGTELERSMNTLYLWRTDNNSGHIVFNIDTKAVVSVNRVVVILTQQNYHWSDQSDGVSKKQSNVIQFTDIDKRVTINDLDLNHVDNDDDDNNNNNNSNMSDESFDHNKENQKEFDNKEKTSKSITTDET